MADSSSRAGERYTTPELLHYVDQLHAGHDAGLEGAFAAPCREGLPAIQVGMSEGKFLTTLVRLVRARKVVEIGTLVGYSAIRLAKALPTDGRVTTLERDPRHAAVARANIAAAGLSERIVVQEGEALASLSRLESDGPFDLVFIDADKGNYDAYGRWAYRNLVQGGLIIADNAYLFGRLLEDSAEAQAMRRFHEETARDFDSVCIPTPDGLVIGLR